MFADDVIGVIVSNKIVCTGIIVSLILLTCWLLVSSGDFSVFIFFLHPTNRNTSNNIMFIFILINFYIIFK